MIQKSCIWFTFIFLIGLIGCSTGKKVDISVEEVKPIVKIFKDKAKVNVITGSLFDARGDFANAILEYQEALRYDPDPGIYYLLSKDYNNLGKYSLAVENLRIALKSEPNSVTFNELLGEIFFNAFEIDSAIIVYNHILKIDSSNVQAMYNLATLYKKNKPLTSIRLYKKLLEDLGPRWDILLNLFEIYGNLDKSSEELNTLEDLIKLDPGNTKLKQVLADFYLKSGKIKKAISIFEDLIELDPENDILNKALGEYYTADNQTDKAITIYSSILKRRKDDYEVKALLAFNYAKNNEWDKAKKYFNDIIENDSIIVEFKLDLGSFCYTLSDSNKYALTPSRNIFLRLSKLYPEDPRPFLYLSAIGVKTDSLEIVEKNFEKFYSLEQKYHVAEKNPIFGTEVGRLFIVKEDFINAVKYLEKARTIYGNDFLLLYYIGFGYSRLGRTEESIDAYERAIKFNPNRELKVELLTQLGLLYDGKKEYQKSDSLYEEGLKLDPDNHLILNNFSYSLSERGIFLERSEKMSKRALEKEPENSSYLDTYGWILYKMEKYVEAEKYIYKAVNLRDAVGGNGAVLNDHLGDIYYKLGNKEKALLYWKRSLEMNPENKEILGKISKLGS